MCEQGHMSFGCSQTRSLRRNSKLVVSKRYASEQFQPFETSFHIGNTPIKPVPPRHSCEKAGYANTVLMTSLLSTWPLCNPCFFTYNYTQSGIFMCTFMCLYIYVDVAFVRHFAMWPSVRLHHFSVTINTGIISWSRSHLNAKLAPKLSNYQ